jgi:phage terminase small subunit
MSPLSQTPRPPRHLTPAARTWWRKICGAYVLEVHHLKILQVAAEGLQVVVLTCHPERYRGVGTTVVFK